VHDLIRLSWGDLGHLFFMDTERLSGLGLEPVITTSELAEYLGVHVQAIYDLRTDGRGPTGIRVGREIRYRISDVLSWLEGLHEPERSRASRGGQH
jgi:excisionase family DNA binding protein